MGEEQQNLDASSFTVAMNTFTRMLDERFNNFAQAIQHQSEQKMGNAVRKATREAFVCKGKGNQQQLEHCTSVLDNLEDVSSLLAENSVQSIETAKRKLEESTTILRKRIKTIKLADKSEFGWATVAEYLSDELASDTDDEKRIFRSEKRAEKKFKERQRVRRGKAVAAARNRERQMASTSTSSSISQWHPIRKQLGPCFKISIFHSLALFTSSLYVFNSRLTTTQYNCSPGIVFVCLVSLELEQK